MELLAVGIGIVIGWIAKEIHAHYIVRKAELGKVWGQR